MMQKGVAPIQDMQNVEIDKMTSRPRAPVLHRKMMPF